MTKRVVSQSPYLQTTMFDAPATLDTSPALADNIGELEVKANRDRLAFHIIRARFGHFFPQQHKKEGRGILLDAKKLCEEYGGDWSVVVSLWVERRQ